MLARLRIGDLVHQAQAGHRVLGVERRRLIAGTDLAVRESLRQRGAADQQRNVDARVLQVSRRDDHLLRALHQQPREANGVRLMVMAGLDDFFRRNLDAEVHHVVAVVAEDDLHQVLADVVDVALHGSQHDLAARRGIGLLHELLQMIDRGLHRFGRLQHFRHDQLIVVEEPARLRTSRPSAVR